MQSRLYSSSQAAKQSEDHFFQANNAKVLCSQGVLKPAGKGVEHSQKCVCGQGVPRNVGWVTNVTLLSCLWQVTFGTCTITKQKYEWAGTEVWQPDALQKALKSTQD